MEINRIYGIGLSWRSNRSASRPLFVFQKDENKLFMDHGQTDPGRSPCRSLCAPRELFQFGNYRKSSGSQSTLGSRLYKRRSASSSPWTTIRGRRICDLVLYSVGIVPQKSESQTRTALRSFLNRFVRYPFYCRILQGKPRSLRRQHAHQYGAVAKCALYFSRYLFGVSKTEKY